MANKTGQMLRPSKTRTSVISWAVCCMIFNRPKGGIAHCYLHLYLCPFFWLSYLFRGSCLFRVILIFEVFFIITGAVHKKILLAKHGLTT